MVADQDVSLAAGNHVDVLAATSTDTSWRFKETKKSGLMGTGGIGFTIGSSKTTHDRREARDNAESECQHHRLHCR